MAEWLYEEGIGENRAALVEGGRILEAAIELEGANRLGSISPARLKQIISGGRRGLVVLADGTEAIIEPVPAGLTEGEVFQAEIVREAIPEWGRRKFARVQATGEASRAGPDLKDRIGGHIRLSPVGPDRLEEAGWSELLDEARTGVISFTGGALRMSLTPAMTLFDVDGDLTPAALAVAGATAAAHAVRRFGLGGSIGVDLPTVPDRASRQAAASAVDRILPQPFERTAVNGFGFLQIVRRRQRPSIPEIIRDDPVGAAARALLRRAERSVGHGPVVLQIAPMLIDRFEQQPDWLEKLRQKVGTEIVLQPRQGLAISAGHVHRQSQ